ncbi:MAG TPA: sensor histidine kinase [Caulobacteraceae bacterium]|nr:sensor histidine kinase [Caulobacteraceae bacterium]
MAGLDEEALARQAEVRHRIANILQLLQTLARMRVQRSPNPATALRWLSDTLAAQGVLQNRLLSPGGDDFALYLADMAVLWRRRAGDRPIVIAVDAAPLPIAESQAAALAVVVDELVANALAHAFDERGGAIEISLAREGGEAVLCVRDDGRGFDADAAPSDTLGLWLIRGLAQQVRGRFDLKVENGVEGRLAFPLAGAT